MTAARKWTKEEIQFIKDNVHMRDKEMAEAMGIPRPTLNTFRNKIGYTSPAPGRQILNEDDVKYFIELHEKGYKCTEISRIFKEKSGKTVSDSRVSSILKKNGFNSRRTYGRREEIPRAKFEELIRFNQKLCVIKAIINTGDCFKTRDKKQDGRTIKGIRLKAKGVYPNFVLATSGECIGYDEIEGVIRSKR